ncbi:MAG: hypothetical protein Ct9H300mP27_12600 [Chloroflexota bacterium]|nr:MAG: hypothetical protein Ct9H300mP27_12600 [Chloroflexota bacterium]
MFEVQKRYPGLEEVNWGNKHGDAIIRNIGTIRMDWSRYSTQIQIEKKNRARGKTRNLNQSKPQDVAKHIGAIRMVVAPDAVKMDASDLNKEKGPF